MSQEDLQEWTAGAHGPLATSTVPWVAAGSPHGWDLALEWIESERPIVATAGWALNVTALTSLLERIGKTIRLAPVPVRQSMNAFVVAAGCHVLALTEIALRIGEEVGLVEVSTEGTKRCSAPFAPDSIRKVAARGALEKKRKTAKC